MMGLLGGLLWTALAAQAGPLGPLDERATGAFVPDEPETVIQQRLDTAIETSVSSMTWLFRPIARPRLQSTVRWCRSVHTESDAEAFAVQCDDDETPFVVPFDATGMTILDDVGDSMDVGLELREDTVRLTVSSDKATQHTDYQFLDDDTMLMTVTIDSRHFGVPLTYWARYRRQPNLR